MLQNICSYQKKALPLQRNLQDTLTMDISSYIQQLIDAGIAHYDMDGCVVMNAALIGGGMGMPNINLHIQNCGNTYNTYNNTYNFYGDHAAMNDIHENTNPNIHQYERQNI